jgi:hypothetical protein
VPLHWPHILELRRPSFRCRLSLLVIVNPEYRMSIWLSY